MNLKIKYYTLLFTVLFLLGSILFSCRKESPDVLNPTVVYKFSYVNAFDTFWHGMNNNYVFWDIDPTNWDAIYHKYRPLFLNLDEMEEDDEELAYQYFKEMTANLVDSHYALQTNIFPNTISPSRERIKKRPDFHEKLPKSYFTTIVPNTYLDAGSLSSLDYGDDDYSSVIGTIGGDILYFHFSDFILSEIIKLDDESEPKIVLNEYLDQIKNPNINGLIVDLRSNGGGNLDDLKILVGSLTDKPFTFGQLRHKSGKNRYDYTPWLDATVYPYQNAKAFTKPIVVIADIHSVSMAEFSTMALKVLPSSNATFVGERTWGGVGPLTKELNFYNSGQFSNSLLKLVYTSTAAFKYIDGKIYEGIGFPPDVDIPFNITEFAAGKDTKIEKAIELIRR